MNAIPVHLQYLKYVYYHRLKHLKQASDKWSNDELGEIYGMSGRQVQRYLRLNELIPELLEKVDCKRIQMVIAVDMSFLSKDVQRMISVFSDRIEILSRGTLAPAQTMEGFFLGESIPVNEKLSEIFLQLHIGEKS